MFSYKKFSACNMAECLICFSDEGDLEHQGCGHCYCHDCWEGFLTSKLTDADNLQIFCPDPACSHFIRKEFILSHLSGDILEKYKNLLSKLEIPVKNGLLSSFCDSTKSNDFDTNICTDADYYHYECISEVDTGWGCSYRCLQMLLSAVNYNSTSNITIPTIYGLFSVVSYKTKQ